MPTGCSTIQVETEGPNVTLPDRDTDEGVVARLLIAESKNPGWASYNAAEALKAMRIMMAVVKNRLDPGPPNRFGAPSNSNDLTDIICKTSPTQFAGFGWDDDENTPTIASQQQQLINTVLCIANTGAPGAYATFVTNAINVANELASPPNKYTPLDPYTDIDEINGVTVQGGAWGWRTAGASGPGGDFVLIPPTFDPTGRVGGQDFYTVKPE